MRLTGKSHFNKNTYVHQKWKQILSGLIAEPTKTLLSQFEMPILCLSLYKKKVGFQCL